MTASTLPALAAYPVPNPETGLISIRPLDAGYHVTYREASIMHFAKHTPYANEQICKHLLFKHPYFGCRPIKHSFLFVSLLFFTQKYPSLNPLPRRRQQVPLGSNPLPSGRGQGEGSTPSRCFNFLLPFSSKGDILTLHKVDSTTLR